MTILTISESGLKTRYRLLLSMIIKSNTQSLQPFQGLCSINLNKICITHTTILYRRKARTQPGEWWEAFYWGTKPIKIVAR